ncbi:hypothetical protein KKB64_02830 [Patescibacteria group bacterium]|nr:hypothetical protein [Patescibacteria group bacterium]MBU1472693.1 hypothetical protein [Patescibacteria group bacterium]
MIKKFSFSRTKSPTDFFAQNSLQFGRRAKRDDNKSLANSLLVLYSKNSSSEFRRLRRRGASPANRGSAAPIKTVKEPVKNIGSNHILEKENFLWISQTNNFITKLLQNLVDIKAV